jgi:hypothetical protein
MNPFHQFSGFLAVCVSVVLAMTMSCQMEPEPENNNLNNGNGNNGGSTITADELSEFLVLKDASKIVGDLPGAPDSKLKINVKDTIYIAKGIAGGGRLIVSHDGSHDITGFYMAVVNGSFYYDVPVIGEEVGETNDVLYIDIAVPAGVDADYPLTVPIKIQPHGADGAPLDEFIKELTIEDAEDEEACLPISNSVWNWIWEFTLVKDNTGDFHTAYAPGMFIYNPPFQHGGCCWNGFSIPAKDDPYCVSGNPEYFELTVSDTYYIRFLEALDLYTNGEYERYTSHGNQIYVTDSSNYCTGEAGYGFDDEFIVERGVHNLSSSYDYINFTSSSKINIETNAPGYGWPLASGKLFYTCHSLSVTFPFNGEEWTVVYRRGSDITDEELLDFFYTNWD